MRSLTISSGAPAIVCIIVGLVLSARTGFYTVPLGTAIKKSHRTYLHRSKEGSGAGALRNG